MSSNLTNSAQLANSDWFTKLVQAALVEYALQNPTDPLSRTLIRDPAYMLPMFVSVVADNPTISADDWQQDQGSPAQQADVRFALANHWEAMTSAIPNLAPAGG